MWLSSRLRFLAAVSTAILAGVMAVAVSAVAQGPPLQTIDWANSALPGAVCRSSTAIPLHNHTATLTRTGFGKVNSYPNPYMVVVYGAYHVAYGNLSGVGNTAAVDVMCSNNGGTADGQLRSADVVFGGSVSSLRTLGIITPPIRGASDNHVPLLGTARFSAGKIVVREYFYGPNDPTCCATGRTTTTWIYSHGRLRAQRIVITRRAAS